ncbi:MAG: response regulator transcription factor [Euryarchaeota archaeon]|nr:response regulator transcription factor [Euryarchaeota archaeon]
MSSEGVSDASVVLVVDDEPQLAELFAAWLNDDWDVRTAHNGEEALAAMNGDVAVVLLDRRMPGKSGDEVLDSIREQDYDCRVIMVTAVDPDFDIIEMGFDDYLVKPVANDELTATVERVYQRREYDETMREYYSLASKRAVLETEKSRPELEGNEEFRELEDRLTSLRKSVDETIDGLNSHEDFAAAFRDLDG